MYILIVLSVISCIVIYPLFRSASIPDRISEKSDFKEKPDEYMLDGYIYQVYYKVI